MHHKSCNKSESFIPDTPAKQWSQISIVWQTCSSQNYSGLSTHAPNYTTYLNLRGSKVWAEKRHSPAQEENKVKLPLGAFRRFVEPRISKTCVQVTLVRARGLENVK
jgi:hypothetical protein